MNELQQIGKIKINPPLNSKEFFFLKNFLEKLHSFDLMDVEEKDLYCMVSLPYSEYLKDKGYQLAQQQYRQKPSYSYSWTGLQLIDASSIKLQEEKHALRNISHIFPFLHDNFFKKDCLFNQLRSQYDESKIFQILTEQNEFLKKHHSQKFCYEEEFLRKYAKKLVHMFDFEFSEHELTNSLFYQKANSFDGSCIIPVYGKIFKNAVLEDIDYFSGLIDNNSSLMKKISNLHDFENLFLNQIHQYFNQTRHFKQEQIGENNFIVGSTSDNLTNMIEKIDSSSMRMIKMPLNTTIKITEYINFEEKEMSIEVNFFTQKNPKLSNVIHKNEYLNIDEIKKNNLKNINPRNIMLQIFDLSLEELTYPFLPKEYKAYYNNKNFGNDYLKKQITSLKVKNILDFQEIMHNTEIKDPEIKAKVKKI